MWSLISAVFERSTKSSAIGPSRQPARRMSPWTAVIVAANSRVKRSNSGRASVPGWKPWPRW